MLPLLAESDWSGIVQLILFLVVGAGSWIFQALKKHGEARQIAETQAELARLDQTLSRTRRKKAPAPEAALPADWVPEVVEEGPADLVAEEAPEPAPAPADEERPAPDLARAFLWREILLPPVALREPR